MPTRSENAWPMRTASWPVMPSTTSSTWCARARCLSAGSSAISVVVDVQPSGGVERSGSRTPRVRACSSARRRRSPPGCAGRRAPEPAPGGGGDPLELIDRGRTVDVRRSRAARACPAAQPARELAGERRLARALETARAGSRSARAAIPPASPGRPPSSFTSSSCTMPTTCWPGVRLFSTSSPSARASTRATKSRATATLDVGLEQRAAHVPQAVADVLRRQPALAGELADHASQAFGKGVSNTDPRGSGAPARVPGRRERIDGKRATIAHGGTGRRGSGPARRGGAVIVRSDAV